jgi:hypothetical protein
LRDVLALQCAQSREHHAALSVGEPLIGRPLVLYAVARAGRQSDQHRLGVSLGWRHGANIRACIAIAQSVSSVVQTDPPEAAMARYKILIARTFYTEVEVDAPSAAAARREVEDYGPDLATQDYPGRDTGEMDARIRSVKAVEREPA